MASLAVVMMLAYLCGFSFILGLFPITFEVRPTLQPLVFERAAQRRRAKPFAALRMIALINKPFSQGTLRVRIQKDLAMGHVDLTVEEFLLAKELCIIFSLLVTYPAINPDMTFFWICMCCAAGYMLPEYWIKGRIRRVKTTIVRELPDAIDLLALCVNAGLDFMLALKWVIEKSPPSIMTQELNVVLQEISVGKPRREALKDLSGKYDLPDLQSFSRTLIQADKMGTSVSEALNILSEDMREARFRRGREITLKAPLKMLVPLLFFIFPVVAILVAGPIFLQFTQSNPFKGY